MRTQSYNVRCNLCPTTVKIYVEKVIRKGNVLDVDIDLSEFKHHMASEHNVVYRRKNSVKHPEPVR